MKTRPRVTSDTQQPTVVWRVVEKQCGACLGLPPAGGDVPACLQAGGACLGGGSTAKLLALGLATFQLVLVG